MRLALERYTRAFSQPRVIVAETLLVPALAVALGIWLNPLDPLCVNSGFPWPWLAPLVLALRYGPLPGMGGAALLLGAWLAFQAAGWITGELPKIYFLGGLVTIMLCGEFSSLWLARARRAEGMQHYLDQRLDQLTQHYYLLRLSHDRLEQDLIGRPLALRDALQALRGLTADGDAAPLGGAADLLRLLAQYCQLEVAALYPMRGGAVGETPVARLGADFPLKRDDRLLRYALEKNALAHLQVEAETAATASDYVIVAPIAAADEDPVGLLVVRNVPFFALHDDMLQTLNLLLGYYADGLAGRALAGPLLAEVACPHEFAFELMRIWHIRRNLAMVSVVVALEFHPRPGYEDLPMQLTRQQRSLDVCWPVAFAGGAVLLTLMPLSGEGAAEGYLARIEQWVKALRGDSLADAGVFPHVRRVDDLPPAALLRQLLSACHVPDQAWAVRANP